MVEPTGTYVPANIARLGRHDWQARPPRQGSSYGRERVLYEEIKSVDVMNLHQRR
ncbi:unnamed protein product [Schistosoma mattheei]|uniref:Uncharacterized protein n=1 Tax=Schistosoma mattheei TaxID=31246 RepID=A0A183NQJ3_9TREM|nr:unnamed protein product [Schistosoma mattheei]